MSEITAEQIHELNNTFVGFKSANEKALAAIEEGNKARAAELTASMEKMDGRMSEIEAKLTRPGLGAPEAPATDEEAEFRKFQSKAFAKMLRGKGHVHLTQEEDRALRSAYVTMPDGTKALATDNATSGGYLLPMNVSEQILELLVEITPMRGLAMTETISLGDTWEGPKEGTTTFSASWVGERGSRSETTAGTFEWEKIPTHEAYANPFVTQKQLDDPRFNIEAYVAKKVAEQLGVLESAAFITGTGVGQPLGLLSTLPGSTAIETVASGVNDSLDTDSLLSLEAELPEPYARGASFLMRRATKFVVRKLKDGNGQYLWQPSLQVGTPPTFDSYPVIEAPDMPAIANAAKAVAFGDFRRAYKIVDRQGIVTRPDPFSNKPHVEMYTTYRVGGQCVLPEAVKILTID